MKHLKNFDSLGEYKLFKENINYPHTNVCLVEGEVFMNGDNTPFYVEAIDESFKVYAINSTFEYSHDYKNGTTLTNKAASSQSHVAGSKIYIRKPEGFTISSSTGIGTLLFEGRGNIGGNIRLILGIKYKDLTKSLPSHAFKSLFADNKNLISAEKLLIASGSSMGCYESMFSGCSGLIKAPQILLNDADAELKYGTVFYYMFRNCTALKEAPVLYFSKDSVGNSANTFSFMYTGCTSLEGVKDGNMSSHSTTQHNNWLNNVAANGVYIMNANYYYQITSGASHVPTGWEIKVCDPDTNRTYIRFKIGEKQYKADDKMTWANWIVSAYNTIGLSIEENTIVSDAGTLMLGNTAVLPTDFVTCISGTNYSIVS